MLLDGFGFRMIEGTEEVEIYAVDHQKKERLSGKIVLPTYCGIYTVTRIADRTFSGCEQIEEVVLPRFLTEIGQLAFSGCTALKQIDFPDGLQAICYGAFSGCTALKQIDFPDGLQTIGNWSFEKCRALQQTLTIPRSVELIDESAFAYSSVRCVILPGSVKTISWNAFMFMDIYTDAESKPSGWTSGSGFLLPPWASQFCHIFYGTTFGYDGDDPYILSVKGADYVNNGSKIASTGADYLIRPYFLPAREGYIFRGWSTAEDGEAEFPTRMFDPAVNTWEKKLNLTEKDFTLYRTEAYPTVLGTKADFDRITPYMPLYAVWDPI